LRIEGRPRPGPTPLVALLQIDLASAVEHELAELGEVPHQRARIPGTAGCEGCVSEGLVAHDDVAHGSLARGRERAGSGEQLATRSHEHRAEPALAPGLRLFLRDREGE